MIDEHALEAVMAIMETSFDARWREAWTRGQVRDSLDMPSTFLVLVDADGEPLSDGDAAGFVLSRQALDEEELLLIAVRPQDRGRGLGRRLIESYAEVAQRRGVHRIFLEMRANNPAHSLYLRSGFVPIGTRPRYYRAADGQALDAITFARHL